jgi:hypothetical protein
MNPYEFSSDPERTPIRHTKTKQDPLKFVITVLLLWFVFSL